MQCLFILNRTSSAISSIIDVSSEYTSNIFYFTKTVKLKYGYNLPTFNLVPGGANQAFFILLMEMAHWALHASQMPTQPSANKRPIPHNHRLINLPTEMTRCFWCCIHTRHDLQGQLGELWEHRLELVFYSSQYSVKCISIPFQRLFLIWKNFFFFFLYGKPPYHSPPHFHKLNFF